MRTHLFAGVTLTLCLFFQQNIYGQDSNEEQDFLANLISAQSISVEGQVYKIVQNTQAKPTTASNNKDMIYQDIQWSLYPSTNGSSSPVVIGNKGQLLWLKELRITLAPSADPKQFGSDYGLSFSGGSANGFYYSIGGSQVLQSLTKLTSDSRVILVEAIRPRNRISQ